MGRTADPQTGAMVAVDEVFDHPAFASLKDGNAAFAVVKADAPELIWANAAAASYWGRGPEGLEVALFGPPGSGWLGRLAASVEPGRPPRMFRTGLAPGLRMRGGMVLARAVAGADGAVAVGFAVPGSAPAGAASADAWHRGILPEAPVPEEARAAGDGSAPDAGADLARRSQVAILRDRLNAAVDGATSLRFIWRTDAFGRLVQIDEATLARLGAPLLTGVADWAGAVARFDPGAGERLASALGGRASWSGLPVRLPVAEGAATAPMTLSGSPTFGPERTFAGYRGFGTIDLAGLEAAPRVPAPHGAEAAVPSPAVAAPTAVVPPPELEPPAVHDAGPSAPPDPASGPSEAGPSPFAHVVDVRAFEPPASGHVLSSSSAPSRPPPASTETTPDDDPPREVPASDEAAFRALGEALRARIGERMPPAGDAASVAGPAAAAAAVPTPTGEHAPTPPGETSAAPAAPTSSTAVLDRLPVPVLLLSGDTPTYANPSAARRLGYAIPADVLAADGLVAGRTGTGLLIRGGDGVERPVEGQATDWDGDGATLWTLAAMDRPDRGSAPEARPDEAEERSVDLLDRVDDAVALLDGQGRIRRLNRRGQGWFEEAGEGAVGRAFTALLAPESHAAALDLLEEARGRDDGATSAPPQREVIARTGATSPVPMLLTLGRLGAAGFYATLRDVTALKRAERDEARSRRDRERDAARLPDILARVDHEIRTPLNAILGFAEVMMDERFGPLGSPRYRDYLKDIHASGTQVVTLVGDLLDLSRIEAGRLDLDVGLVDVNKIVAEIVAQMQPEAHRERLIVRTSLASRIPAVVADERSTRQIVQHLLSNAVKFNEPGGQVIVSTAQDDAGAVVLRIRDTGIGMTDAEIAAALEPFHDASPTRPANGNGLGLPLARALIGANGASLSIRSRPRDGTLVEVAFPPNPPEEARRPA